MTVVGLVQLSGETLGGGSLPGQTPSTLYWGRAKGDEREKGGSADSEHASIVQWNILLRNDDFEFELMHMICV